MTEHITITASELRPGDLVRCGSNYISIAEATVIGDEVRVIIYNGYGSQKATDRPSSYPARQKLELAMRDSFPCAAYRCTGPGGNREGTALCAECARSEADRSS